MSIWARSTVWVDSYGSRTITKLQSSAGAAAVEPFLEALSNAGVLNWWESVVTDDVPAPVVATYQSVANRASLSFICADGTLYTVMIPAASRTIFLADGITVDPTVAAVAAFIGAAVATPLVNNSGSPVTAFVSGTLMPYAKQPL